jgi:outer membrane receptor protein involved in Fe transport
MIAGVAAAAFAWSAAPAMAQTAQPAPTQSDEEAAQVEEVIVTGSRIRRDPTTAPTPLTQVSREAIFQSGSNSVVDYLADVPALQTSQVPEDTTGNSLGTGGLSTLNLRGLGQTRTLVLIDGRRHAGAAYSSSSAVDIDTIPALLIENIEVITGAASAVYGADAVAGVVNFILRQDFEGLEADFQIGQMAQDGNGWRHRASVLWGDSWMDDRLRAYVSGEYEHSDRVRNTDIGILKRHGALLQLDLDPNAATPDGVIDADWRENLQLITTAYGGSLTLAHTTPASPAADPDIPAGPCTAQATTLNGSCFVMDPGFSFAFTNAGPTGLRPFDFGTWRQQASQGRTAVQGSQDARPWSDTDNIDRLPKQEAWRFQTGGTFEITDSIDLFGEFKYVEENNQFGGTPVSVSYVMAPFTATTQARVLGVSNAWLVGNDNAFLPVAARAAILANTGGTNGQRALFRQYFLDGLDARTQTNDRETQRYVVGFKGEFDNILGLKDGNWELSYNASEVSDNNVETGLPDQERLAWSFDAVTDTAGVLGTPGAVVCRVRLQAAQGQQIRRNRDFLDSPSPTRFYAANDPAITGCQPINMFGATELPADRFDYLFSTQARGFSFEQQNFLGFISGDLWDFWGAGAIGVALGVEHRTDGFSGFRSSDNDRDLRVLTGNVYVATPYNEYSSTEGFVEAQVPLLRDVPFVQSLDFSAAYRYADYSQFGEQDVYSLQGSWRINDSLMFRGTHGTSIRVPTLNDLYRGAAQTFSTLLDPCVASRIAATVDPDIKAYRIANCAADGIPTNYVDPTGDNSIAGFNGNNPNLQPEESVSNTFSVVWTPSQWPNFSLVLDYFNIEIENAILSVTAQNALFLCYDIEVRNSVACATITRGPDFDITSFVQGGLNYAKDTVQGVDFAMRYSQDLADIFGSDLGTLGLSVRGTWNIDRDQYADLVNPNLLTSDGEDSANWPRLRALTTISWAKGPLQVNWNIDAIASTEFTDSNSLANDPDVRPYYLLENGSWVQHDVNVRYELNNRITLRGGVTNLLDRDPDVSAFIGGATLEDYDLYGRRFFVGLNAKF